MKYYVGTSGWHYEHWRDEFYPEGLAKARWLEFYSQHFSTVELNNSFYQLPSEKAFINWKDVSPPNFVFAVKVSRFITHIKRLKDTAEPIAKFMARARILENKLGPFLYQLPQNMKQDCQTLEDFLKQIPEDVYHVFEFRHNSWFDKDVFNLLSSYKAGFCMYDMPEFRTPVVATSDFAYIRFHGSHRLYGGCYSDEELDDWVQKVLDLKVSAVYAYFNNDAEGFAIKNALTFRHFFDLALSDE